MVAACGLQLGAHLNLSHTWQVKFLAPFRDRDFTLSLACSDGRGMRRDAVHPGLRTTALSGALARSRQPEDDDRRRVLRCACTRTVGCHRVSYWHASDLRVAEGYRRSGTYPLHIQHYASDHEIRARAFSGSVGIGKRRSHAITLATSSMSSRSELHDDT